jgi:hypothetical protein
VLFVNIEMASNWFCSTQKFISFVGCNSRCLIGSSVHFVHCFDACKPSLLAGLDLDIILMKNTATVRDLWAAARSLFDNKKRLKKVRSSFRGAKQTLAPPASLASA